MYLAEPAPERQSPRRPCLSPNNDREPPAQVAPNVGSRRLPLPLRTSVELRSGRCRAQYLLLASLAVVTHIEGHYRRGDETQDEAASAPLQPYSDRVAEEDDHDGGCDQRDDHGMGAEALHHRNRWIGFWYTTRSLWRF